MKTAKKILCLVLALLMALSICVTAFASLFPLNPESESSSSSGSKTKYYWKIKYSPGSATIGSPFTEKYQYNPAKHLYVDIAFPEPEFANPEGLEFDYWEIWALDDDDMSIVDEKYSNKYRKGDGDFRVNGNYQFIAHWKSGTTKVTVTYSPGSGNGTAQSFQYNKNETIAIKKSKADLGFTKSGYVFAGWDINGKNYASGQAYQLGTSNVTITAKWNVYVPPESSSSVAPPPSSSSESVPESSSVPEESSQPEEQQEETPAAFEPQNLAFNIAGDIPVTGIEYYITEDIGGTPSLWVTALTASTAEDPVTKKFITSGDALSAFDLSLLSDGSNYSGTSTGSITYKLNGTQTGKNSNYENRVLALAHVVRADKYQGSTWYKADGNKAVLYNKETGETTEVKGLTFAEEDGVFRPVISDVDMFKSFVYESSSGYLTEIKLAPDEGASYIAMDTTSLSPVLLIWVEKGEAAGSSAGTSSEGGIPVWVWIVVGAVILIVAVMVALYIAGKNSQKKSSDYRRERIEAAAQKKSSDDDDFHITGLDD